MHRFQPKFLRNAVRFQYGSNYRFFEGIKILEPFQNYLVPVAPNLVLNGNIGNVKSPALHQFLDKASKSFDSVYWIPGSLELTDEKYTAPECLDKIRELAQKYSIGVGTKLDRAVLDSQVTTLSTTGWGEINERDYHILWTNPNNGLKDKIAFDLLRCLKADEEAWIRRQVNRTINKLCLFTHHNVSNHMRGTDEYQSIIAHIHGQGPNLTYATSSNTLVTSNSFHSPNYSNKAFIEVPSSYIHGLSFPESYSIGKHISWERNLL